MLINNHTWTDINALLPYQSSTDENWNETAKRINRGNNFLTNQGPFAAVLLVPNHTRTRRALMMFKDVLLRTRKTLLLYKVYGDSAHLVLNETSLKFINTLLALSRRYAECQKKMSIQNANRANFVNKIIGKIAFSQIELILWIKS